jgi:glycosyltransferase involved in cell wall biosynthesis
VKNLDLLFNSFTIVKKKIPNAKLLVVGDGPDKKRLNKISEDLGINNDVIFTGFLKENEIPQIINSADVLAISTLKNGCEGSPTVLREAFACGIPVVSTDVGDVKDVLDNEFLGIVADWEKDNYAQALIKMLETDTDIVKSKCIQASRKFNFEYLGKRLIHIYKKTLKNRGFL